MTLTRTFLGLGLVCLLALTPAAATTAVALNDGIDDKTRDNLIHALKAELSKLTDHKNADGKKD